MMYFHELNKNEWNQWVTKSRLKASISSPFVIGCAIWYEIAAKGIENTIG